MQIDEDSLMDSIAEYLKPEKEYIYLRSESGESPRSIGGIMDGEHAMWFLKITLSQSERGNLLYVGASSYIKIPESQRVNVDDLLKQINSVYRDDFELDMGNPEFDLPGEVVNCIGWLELKEDTSNETNFVLLLDKCITVSEAYFDAIMSVGYGGVDPSMAMENLKNEKVTAKIMH